MKQNIGTLGRLSRFIASIIILGFSYFKGSWVVLALGLFVLFESIAGWCPLHYFIDKKSCSK